jgi:hypothetical protein
VDRSIFKEKLAFARLDSRSLIFRKARAWEKPKLSSKQIGYYFQRFRSIKKARRHDVVFQDLPCALEEMEGAPR